MAPYEALYGRRCRSHVGLFEVDEEDLIGPDLFLCVVDKFQLITDKHMKAQSRQ